MTQTRREYLQKYYRKNKERIDRRSRLWQINNRERHNAYQRKARLKKKLLKQNRERTSNQQTDKPNMLKLFWKWLFRRGTLD